MENCRKSNENAQKIIEKTSFLTKPQSNRAKYRQVYEWSKSQLSKMQKLLQDSEHTPSQIQILQQQKKIILSMLLQIARLTKQECMQKGLLIEEMLNFALQFTNQHQKHYDMLSYTQIKHFRDSIEDMQKQYQLHNKQLKEQIKLLKQDKEHRWRNLFMVVKDNRIIRRRNGKLLKTHRQLVWRIKQLEQDLISLRSQNEKYKVLNNQSNKQNLLKVYVTNQILLNRLDERVKMFPGRARRILKKELIDLQINQLNSLESKLKFIVQAMEQNGQTCQEFDGWNDNVQTTRLFYNVSVQTYIETQNAAVNTVEPVVPKKTFQSVKVQSRAKDFVYLETMPKIFEYKIMPIHKKPVVERKRTQEGMIFNMSVSRFKRRTSTSSNNNNQLANTSQLLAKKISNLQKFKVQQVYNIFLGGKAKKMNKFMTINVAKSSNQKQTEQLAYEDELRINQNSNQTSQTRSYKKIEFLPNNINIINKLKTSKKVVGKKETFTRKKEVPVIEVVMKKQATNNENNSIFQFTESNNQIKEPQKNLTFQSLVYKLQYKPAHYKNQIQSQILEDPLLHFESQIIVEQKLPKKFNEDVLRKNKKQNKNNNNNNNNLSNRKTFSGNSQNLTIFRNNSIQKTKTCFMNETGIEKYFGKKDETILQVYQTNSNPSMENLQSQISVQRNINYQSNNKIKVSLNNAKNMNSSHQKYMQTSLSDFKLSKGQIYARHKRQYTQNLEILNRQKYQTHFTNRVSNMVNHDMQISCNQEQKNIQKSIKMNTEVSQKKVARQPSSNKPQKINNNKVKIVEDRYLMNSQKLIEKVLASIFIKRKQIIAHPQNLKQFMESFLSSMFGNKGNNLNLCVKSKWIIRFFTNLKELTLKKQANLQINLFFQKLIPLRNFQFFSEDMFVLFAIMLQKLNSYGVLGNFNQIGCVPKQYGLKVIEYMCSIYLSKSQTQLFISFNIIQNKQQTKIINMFEAYIKLVAQLQRIVFKSELWQFLQQISSSQSSALTEDEIESIVVLLRYISAENQQHRQRIAVYAANKLPLHRLCLYAYRFEWLHIYSIKSWIKSTYLDYFGTFSLNKAQMQDLCISLMAKFSKNQKNFQFLTRTLSKLTYKSQKLGEQIDENFLKFCQLVVSIDNLQKMDIFSPRLLNIQQIYKQQIMKILDRQVDKGFKKL